MEASLYVHVPFCAGGKCDYCDFYSVPLPDPWSADPRPALYVQTLLSEAQRLFETLKPESIPTLYIGGGTPSVLGPAGILRLLCGLSELISRYSLPPAEVTIEANPESADEAFLSAAREGGATRLSLGVQTFFVPSRQAAGRIGEGSETLLRQRLALTAGYFPGAFSADLISGLPRQNERVLLDDIGTLLGYRPAHVSLYALTLEPGTALAARAPDKSLLPSADDSDSLWLSGRDTLEKAGYAQYEVSNFCPDGKESRHNIRYWRMQNWLALGPAASGTIINDETGSAFRYTIPPDADAWLSAGGCGFSQLPNGSVESGALAPITEELDRMTLIKETLLMGFRYIEGPDGLLFRRRFGLNIGDRIPKTVDTFSARGFLRKDKTALTKEGLLLLNRFLIEAFGELENGI